MKKSIINEILNDPKLKQLNQIEQARYVYIKLGEYFIYDQKYFTSPKILQKRIYKRKAGKIKDKVVCTSGSRVYAHILNELGIKADVVIKEPSEKNVQNRLMHGYTRFEIDGKQYAADLINDMNYIKVGLKTTDFMKKKDGFEYSTKEDEEILLIDDKIGYTKDGIYPMDDYMINIKRKMSVIFDMDEQEEIEANEKVILEKVMTELGGDEGISEIRKQLGIKENITDEERSKLKIDYMTRNMGFEHLDCLSKEVYLHKFARKTLSKKDTASIKKEKIVACVDKDKKMIKFLIVEFQNGDGKIYQIEDGKAVQSITQEEIGKRFEQGMKTLSKKKREEYTKMLAGEEFVNDKKIGITEFFSKKGIFKQILNGNTTISKLNNITRSTKNVVNEQSKITKNSEKNDTLEL